MIAPDLQIKKLKLTNHAYQRVAERFEVTDKIKAVNYVKSRLGNSKYIGMVAGVDGELSHMYTYDKMAIHISLDLSAVKTVMKLNTSDHFVGLKDRIAKLYEKEFKKYDTFERTRLKKLEHLRIKTEADIAILKYKKYKTRSFKVKESCDVEVVRLSNEVLKLETDIKQIQTSKREIARAIATVVI